MLEVNGDTVVHVGMISEDGALEMVNTLTKVFFSQLAALILISPGGWDRGCVQEQTCESGGGVE